MSLLRFVPLPAKRQYALEDFFEREDISWNTLLQPATIIKLLYRYRFFHFLAVGGSGVLINLFVTWSLTTFVFGLERYFTAYLFGIAANLLFSFTLYTVAVFKTSRDHLRRLVVYAIYILAVLWLQATLVRLIVPMVGLQFYLLVIAGVIGAFAVMNFLVFKVSIFRERLD